MKEYFKNWNPKGPSLDIVNTANHIINKRASEGYTLTLRQLYYQFVANYGLTNSEKSYKSLGQIITKARNAGLISWTAIEDRNRSHRAWSFTEDEQDIIDTLHHQILFDRWARQDYYVEVWVEKEDLLKRLAAKWPDIKGDL